MENKYNTAVDLHSIKGDEMDQRRFDRIRTGIEEIPVIDIHTHLGTGGMWQARSLADILFYHWLGTELRNAGCPEEICAPKGDSAQAQDPRDRVRLAVPYCARIRNTSNYWVFSGLMRNLYGIEGGLTEKNWEKAFDAVAEKATDLFWEMEVLRRARIEKAAVERGCVPRDSSPYFNYAYAEPLYGAGLGDPRALEKMVGRNVESGEALDAALTNTIRRLARKDAVRALHVWLPASWRYTQTEEREIDRLLYFWTTGETISSYEQNCLASFSADICARAAANHNLVVQLFHGSTAYGRGMQVGTWHPDFLRTVIYHTGSNEKTEFDLFLATRNASHEATSMARMHTNLMVSGAWWHGFTPTTIREFFRDRLEMLPMTRWSAFYSDGYCVEWCYGKLLLTKNMLAVALAQLVGEGLLGDSDVEPIARAVLYENPKREYLERAVQAGRSSSQADE
jgi:hypothetical protein